MPDFLYIYIHFPNNFMPHTSNLWKSLTQTEIHIYELYVGYMDVNAYNEL